MTAPAPPLSASVAPVAGVGLGVERLCFGFADGPALLDDFSFAAGAGAITAIMGRSGCGKSTLLNIIAGNLEPHSGEVRYGDLPIARLRQQGRISYLNQKPLLLPWLTVEQNLRAPAKMVGRSLDCSPDELLGDLGLEGVGARYPGALSGGMYQRAALARALFVSPSLLLLDEPFSALDEITRINAYAVLRRIVAQQRICCILVTHDIAEMMTAADRFMVLVGHPARAAKDEAIERLTDPQRAQLRTEILEVLQ